MPRLGVMKLPSLVCILLLLVGAWSTLAQSTPPPSDAQQAPQESVIPQAVDGSDQREQVTLPDGTVLVKRGPDRSAENAPPPSEAQLPSPSTEAPLNSAQEPVLAGQMKYPTGVILVKGAEPSASDSVTPLPESGRVVKGVYRNDYFGLAYSLPGDWKENYAGPPPSDSGTYVLALAGPSDEYKGTSKATVLIQAHDLFFSLAAVDNAMDLVTFSRERLASYYEIERNPEKVKIADRTFIRYDYKSEVAELHWVVLTTQIRCHAVQFIFTSSDTELLESLIREMSAMQLPHESGAVVAGDSEGDDDTPVCMADYATAKNITNRVDPVFSGKPRFNPIPVRIIIDKRGRVRHIHVLSAFPDQAKSITDALEHWTFTPYSRNGKRAEVETGILFGYRAEYPKQAKKGTTDTSTNE